MKKILIISLLFVCSVGFGQENEPAYTLGKWGITIPTNIADNVPNYSDVTYTSVVYINGDSTGNDATHWNTLNGKTIQDNTAYLFRRGVFLDEGSVTVTTTAKNILIGAYGTGTRPKINLYIFRLYGDYNITVRDIHLVNTTASIMQQHEEDSIGFIYNCEFEREADYSGINEGALYLWGSNMKVFANVVHGQTQDGIYHKDAYLGNANSEYAYNYIYDVSQTYFDGNRPVGDCLQLNTFMDAYIHHNVMDRHTTPNKFCLILSSELDLADRYWGNTPQRSIVEHNVFIIPLAGAGYGGAGSYYYGPCNTINRKNEYFGGLGLAVIYIDATAYGGNHVYGNTAIGGGTPFYSGSGDNIYNNTFYNQTDLAAGNSSASFVSNNVFNDYDARFDDGTNEFADQSSWPSLVVDAADSNLNPTSTSALRDDGTWNSTYMSSEFIEDMNGNTVTQVTGLFEVGALMYDDGTGDICDGVTITPTVTSVPDTAGRGVAYLKVESVTGGTSPYTYLWTYPDLSTSTADSIGGLNAGTYNLVVYDNNTCISNTNYAVNNISSVLDGNIEVVSVYVSDSLSSEFGSLKLIDNDILSKWTTDVSLPYAVLKFDGTYQVDSFNITVYENSEDYFTLQQAFNGEWGEAVSCTTSVGSTSFYFDLDFVADSVKLISNGRLVEGVPNAWTSVYEIDFFGSAYTPPAPAVFWNMGDNVVTGWNNINPTADSVSSGNFQAKIEGYEALIVEGSISNNFPDNVQNQAVYGAGDSDSLKFTGWINSDYCNVNFSSSRANADPGTRSAFVDINYVRVDTIDAGQSILIHSYDSIYCPDSIITITLIENNASNFTYLNGVQIFEIAASDPCDTTTIITTGVVDSALCFGSNTGKVTTSTIGGVTPYSYMWSSGETVDSIYNKSAGVYSITVTDSNGCVGIKSFTILQPLALGQVAVYNKQVVTCYGDNDGSITLNGIGGTEPYSFYWDSLGVFSSQIDTLYPGYEHVTLTDSKGCVNVAQYLIENPDDIKDNYDILSKNYDNKTGNGSILLFPQGGTGILTYEWNNGYTGQNRTGLRPGGYTISITDINGCVQNYEYVIRYVYSPYHKSKAIKTNKGLLLQNGKVKL